LMAGKAILSPFSFMIQASPVDSLKFFSYHEKL